jgi:hypothetical protein
LEALRIPKDATISKMPMTASHTPTTSARVTIEAHNDAGEQSDHAEENRPSASRQCGIADRGNRCGHTTEDESDANPDGQQQHGVALTEMTKCQHGQDQRRGAADEQQNAAARRDMQAEGEHDLGDTGDQQIDTEGDRGGQDGYSRP